MEAKIENKIGPLWGERHAEFRIASPDDAMMRQINKFTLAPLTREQVAAFTMDLANDQIDRHFSRFPEVELKRIVRMVVGKPLMELHDLRGRLPRGTFFRAEFVKDSGQAIARPDVYILRTPQNEEFIAHIMGGVYRGTSIGFNFDWAECSICGEDMGARDSACRHWPGMEYDGARCHYIIHGVNDVYEGSVVPLGSQSTEFVAARTADAQGIPLLKHICETRGVEIPPKIALAEKSVDIEDPSVQNTDATDSEARLTRDEFKAFVSELNAL